MQVFNRKVHQKVYWIHSKQKYSNVVNHYFKSMLENQKGTRLMLAAQKPKIWSQIVAASLFSPLGNNSWNVYGEKKWMLVVTLLIISDMDIYQIDSLELKCFCFAFFSSWEIIPGLFVGGRRWKLVVYLAQAQSIKERKNTCRGVDKALNEKVLQK